jgi:uncharacterized protein
LSDIEQPPTGLDWIILKIAQRCNLNCTYCYVFNRGDVSWKSRPPTISNEVLDKLSLRIATHCDQYGIGKFVVELHGGEPLLVGKSRMQEILDRLRARNSNLTFIMQTNGLLLDEEWLRLFDANGIRFGLSLDGPAAIADTQRIRHDGSGSTVELLEIINRLRSSGDMFDRLNSGILCVINPQINGGELVRWYCENGFKGFDFLLPDGNYVNLPFGWSGPGPYLRFLLEAFDQWYGMGDAAPQIRMFEVMVLGLFGVRPTLDSFGGDLKRLCVVESDGAIGVIDTIRLCGGRFANDSLNIFTSPLDAHVRHFDLDALQEPCRKCQECAYFGACGGGYLPHRFDGLGFSNPSFYCGALYDLADHIRQRMSDDLPECFKSVRKAA